MTVDKAWKKWLKKRKLSWMWVDPDDVSKISFTAGVDFGIKQSRIDTLKEVQGKMSEFYEDNMETGSWIDTKLEKVSK